MKKFQSIRNDLLEHFNSLKSSGGVIKPLSNKQKKKAYYRLKRFGSHKGVLSISADRQDTNLKFNKLWLLSFPQDNNSANFLIGLNTATGEIDAVEIRKDRAEDETSLRKLSQTYLLTDSMPLVSGAHGARKSGRSYNIPNLDSLKKRAETQIRYNVSKLSESFKAGAFHRQVSQDKDSFTDSVQQKADSLLRSSLEETLEDLYEHIDAQILKWANEIREYGSSRVADNYSAFDIYNHLIRAKGERGAEYRYTALRQFSVLGRLFISSDIWDKIDEGKDPLKTLSDHIGVQRATLKHLTTGTNIFQRKSDDFNSVVKFLDAIPSVYWPENNRERHFFKLCMSLALSNEEHFGVEATQIFKDWVRTHKKKSSPEPHRYWNYVLFQQLKKRIQVKAENSKDNREPRIVKTLSDLDTRKQNKGKFWTAVIQDYNNIASNVKDMKNDILQKIIKPAFILEARKRGIQIHSPEIIEDWVKSLEPSFWGGISEQINASDYWHSPRVNMRRRFDSAAMDDNYQAWPFILKNVPYEIEDGIYIHPLGSKAALKEESRRMGGFCIWSFGSYFYTRSFHMMSIRDAEDNIISTLTILDHETPEGREVKFVENKASSNRQPPPQAAAAAEKLIEQLNSGELEANWVEIDEARAHYKVNMIENSAGYNIHDFETRQQVFDIYKPCLPKKHIRRAGNDVDSFFDQINVPGIIDQYIMSSVRIMSSIDKSTHEQQKTLLSAPHYLAS